MAKPLTLGEQRRLGVLGQTVRVLDEGLQLREPRLLGRLVASQVVVPTPSRPELPPGGAQLHPQPQLLLADERVEDVELVRGPREPALLELARHRDQPLRRCGQILPRSAPAPRVGARPAVREHAPRQDEPLLVLRLQVGERLELILVEQPGRDVELGLHVCLLRPRADERRVALRAEQEPDRLGEDRLPGAGLAGDRVQPRSRLEVRLADEDEVLDAEPTKQRSPGTS